MSNLIKIVILGNGFGGIYALKNLHKVFHNDPRIKITLVGERNYFLFTPLLHEVATGSINPENIIEPIQELLQCCLEEFHLGKVENVDVKNKIIKSGEKDIPYDYLIMANGSQTNFYNIPGAEKYSMQLKTLEDAIKIKNNCILQMEKANEEKDSIKRQKMLRFVIVGGGPTGVELAAEMHEFIMGTFSKYYMPEIIKDASIVLIHKGEELLPQFSQKLRAKSLKTLEKKGIEVKIKTGVVEIGPNYVLLDNGLKLPSQNIIWVAGIKPNEINISEPFLKSKDGKIVVNEYLQIEKHREIFALGDNSLMIEKGIEKPLPALAQVAVKEAESVAQNIKQMVESKTLKPFLYEHTGSLLSLGQWMAIGEINNFHFSGHLAWWFWRTVYLSKIISWRKKWSVAMDWTMDLFSPRDISKI